MSQLPHHAFRETRTLRFARFVVRNRAGFGLGLIGLTLFFFYPILNSILGTLGSPIGAYPRVRIDTSARALFPDHPYIHAQDQFAGRFGSSSLVAIGIRVEEGSIFTPDHLARIHEITRRIDGLGFESHAEERDALRDALEEQGVPLAGIRAYLDRRYPPYPVDHNQIDSLAHASTRVIQIEPDGSVTQAVLMERVPETQEEADALRERVRQGPPALFGRLVSRDEKGALITAGFVTDRLDGREVYRAVFDHVQQIQRDFEDESFRIFVSGQPIQVGWILRHADQILLFIALTIGTLFVLLWLYFRRWHGVLIPMVAAVATVIWGLGFTGWMDIRFDPLILVIPTIITARAVSHTVQMAERFFENYEVMLPRHGDPQVAKVEASTLAMGELIVPGTLGIVTDVAGLLVIMVTTIPQMQDLALFGAFWVLAIIATVEILHPILICYLPAPAEHAHFLPPIMVRFTRAIGNAATHPVGKYAIAAVTLVLFAGSTGIALFHSRIGEATPGTSLFWPDHEFNVATAEIAERFGGVEALVVYADGDRPNAAADPDPLRAMERFERYLGANTDLGASASLVPFLRSYWRINHYGDPKWSFVPSHPGTVRAAIFQLQQNGPPGFLRSYMTDDGRVANVAFFYPDREGETVLRTIRFAEKFIEENPLGEISIRLDRDRAEPDSAFFDPDRLKDMAYYLFGPLAEGLAGPRNHTLTVRIRQSDGRYEQAPVVSADERLPAWIREFREETHRELGDVDAWWESDEYGIRAVAVDTENLMVADRKAVDPTPTLQPTRSWTRGVQFVMAGGSLGIVAAINEEVERSHVANISLIFVVIFLLHSVTYWSIPSGCIIFLQIATATMVSLAYMALRGVGLDIHTLPVQSVGVGIGVDYAIYIVDRIRQEVADTADIDEAVRRAVRTTGMAVTFTATTVTGGIFLWMFSSLRFQAEMAQLLVFLMILNMLGAITVVPAFYSILRPRVATALLSEERRGAVRDAD